MAHRQSLAFSLLSDSGKERRSTVLETHSKVEKVKWRFATDHEEEVQLGPTLPSFPPSRPTIPATMEQKAFLVVFDEDEDNEGVFAWIENTWAQSIVGFVILMNAVIIGLETDHESVWWVPIEHSILVFFTAELVLKLCRYGVLFFGFLGNLFDFFVLATGVFDLWILPLFTLLFGVKQEQNVVLQIMQLLRLLRIVRLIRLVKIIKPLYSLALGLYQAMQGMVWVLIFLLMMLYAVSILTARTLGVSSVGEGDIAGADDEASVRAMFAGVLSSMFVLFESITCWSLVKFDPVFEILPGTRLMAVLFYIFANWALLAVMTGVVNEKMMAVKERMAASRMSENEEDPMSEQRGIAEAMLIELFSRADADNSGSVSREEFNSLLLCTDLMKPLMSLSGLDAQDLGDLFDWLDHDKDDSVSSQEFIQGFRWLLASLSPKGLLQLEEELGGDIRILTKRIVRCVNDAFDKFFSSVAAPLSKITAVTEQIQRLDAVLADVKHATQEVKGKLETSLLDAVEMRMVRRLEVVAQAVQKLDELQAQGLIKLSEEHLDEKDLQVAAMLSGGGGMGVMRKSRMSVRVSSAKDLLPPPDETTADDEEPIFFQPEEDTHSEVEDQLATPLPAGIGRADRQAAETVERPDLLA